MDTYHAPRADIVHLVLLLVKVGNHNSWINAGLPVCVQQLLGATWTPTLVAARILVEALSKMVIDATLVGLFIPMVKQ